MGVTGLWDIVKPCARPTKLETLNRKRLAVDASIWIYQFLKAVRDKEGNALRNSHVVGFFRRICKLLYFGIKPVFVFDGGAPALKRNVIRQRKQRKEGRREDAARTASKLLAVQMQRAAEDEERKRKEELERPPIEEEEVPDDVVYADETQMTQQERQAQRKFRKKDAYHLPDMDMSMNEMGGPNDPRVMSLEDLQTYARQFEAGEDINVYDFSKIDYDSPFFMSLPASDRYNILNAARLRSRLRMGYSKEHLDTMFPDRMAFSKFQIERVTERNELTQRLMNINGGDDMSFGMNAVNRVAGEKGREYVLVKNDGVEGGWALGVVSNEGTTEQDAIDLDKPEPVAKEESESDDEFEDVAIEGLNRLPKRASRPEAVPNNDFARQRQAFYNSRKQGARRKPRKPAVEDETSLFVAEQPAQDEEEEWENVGDDNEAVADGEQGAEDEELQRAIAMSLGQDQHQPSAEAEQSQSEEEDEMREVFNQSAVDEARPIPKGGGRAIANIVNKRAFQVAPESREVTSFGVPTLRDEEESEEDTMDFRTALAESRRGKRKTTPPGPRYNNVQPHSPNKTRKAEDDATKLAKKHGFSGPLPFEKLDLGSSLLGKKKMEQKQDDAAGGFENPDLANNEPKKAEPLPPWFSGNLEDDMQKQRAMETEDARRAREYSKQFQFDRPNEGTLRRMDTGEVIDLDAEETEPGNGEVIDLDADEPTKAASPQKPASAPDGRTEGEQALDAQLTEGDVAPRLGDMADIIRAKPPSPSMPDHPRATPPKSTKKRPFDDEDSETEDIPTAIDPPTHEINGARAYHESTMPAPAPGPIEKVHSPDEVPEAPATEDDEMIEWSESEDEASKAAKPHQRKPAEPASEPTQQAPGEPEDEETEQFEDVDMSAKRADIVGTAPQTGRSPSAEFEDVDMTARPPAPEAASPMQQTLSDAGIDQATLLPEEEENFFSDTDDEETMRNLAQETEENVRFQSELTQSTKSKAQIRAELDKDLKQLHQQHKNALRDADDVTHVMITECQQILKFFGIPYVIAPMEAEAQCAELVRLGLVDGIVTDDSDCFLFGGTRIYKNFFNQAKFVECYLASDLEKEFDLTREKLISVAQLLGSDYTEGLPGVGPVTAIEVVSEFPELKAFKDWWTGVQMQTITKEDDKNSAFRKKFRRNATKIFLPPAFPDPRVEEAYLKPDVDSDPENFQFGVIDILSLKEFLMTTVGWSPERTDEILMPVIRDMNRRVDEGTQANITQFFEGGVGVGAAGTGKGNEAYAPRKRAEQGGKRMGGALKRMAERAQLKRGESGATQAEDGNGDGADAGEVLEQPTKHKGRKRKQDAAASDEGSDFEAPKRKAKKGGGRGRKAAAE